MASSRHLIAIDIDDTIADSTESLRLLVNKRLNVDLGPEAYQIKEDYWGYYERVWEANDIGGKVSLADFAEEMVEDQSHVPLLPSAQFAITQLAKEYDIVLITSRDQSWEDATRRWLDANLGDNVADVYFVTSHTDSQALTKGQLCRHLGAVMLIDDNIEHCQSALDEGVEAILFGAYGWHHTAPDHMTRCQDWSAVLDTLNKGD